MKHYTKMMILATVLMMIFQSVSISFTQLAFAEESTSNLVIEHGTPDYILVGEERQLKAVRSHDDGSVEDVTALSNWVSSDATIGTISNPGLLIGIAPGDVTVTADVYGETTSTSLSVVDYLRLEVQVPNNMLTIGDSTQITAQAVLTNDYYIEDAISRATFDSQDPTIADVSSTGVIHAISEGETFINVRVGKLVKTIYTVVSKVEEEPILIMKSGTVLPDDLENMDRVIANIDKLGLNTVVVPVRFDVLDPHSHELSMHPGDVEHAKALIDVLNERGVNVILEAYPWIAGGTVTEVEYDPSDMNEFFWNYKTVVWSTLLQEIAIPKDVYAVIAGSSYTKLESNLWYWRGVFNYIKEEYTGKLTYKTSWWVTADWDSSTMNAYNEKKSNLMFGYIDFITIAAYFELSDKPGPSTAELITDLNSSSIHARHQKIHDEIRSFAEVWGRDIFFGELGIPSVNYGTSAPWNPVVSDVPNEEIQRNAFEAYQDVFGGDSWFKGYSIWQISNESNNYYPVGKEAEPVIRDFHPELASPIQSLTSRDPSLQLIAGETRQLHIQGHYSNNGKADLTRIVSYNSSNPEVASIASDGTVLSHRDGLSTITVNYYDASIDIQVEVKPDTSHNKQLHSFQINEVEGTIDEDYHTVSVQMPYGTDLQELVATFKMDGVSAEVAGQLQVSGETKNDFSSTVIYSIHAMDGSVQSYTVTVLALTDDDISKLQITGLPQTMIVGETNKPVVQATFPDSSTAEITSKLTWELTNPAIVEVREGQLKALRPGKAKLSVTIGDIHSDEYSITVQTKESELPTHTEGSGGYTSPSTEISNPGNVTEDVGESVEGDVPTEGVESIFTFVINRSNLVKTIQSELTEVKPSKVNYRDLTDHWGGPYIQQLHSLQGITGYPDGSFRPNNAITRAEFSIMLDRVFSPSEGIPEPVLFKDVDTHWAKEGILQLAEQGILRGYADGTFKPDQYLSRAEVVELVGRIVELKNFRNNTSPFHDINHTWNQEKIELAYAAGLIQGRTAEQFVPDGSVTRAEATTLLIRMLSLDPDLGPMLK
ncbi:S-layer homology domain-containing protein [Paenibacillus sp. FSL R7-0026]|uniref:S-layer homology domain-containing protein n=1 Tax=Paenibacillus sp. FSL R7-0026 TaxID=2921668 RepID=UPI0030FB43A1